MTRTMVKQSPTMQAAIILSSCKLMRNCTSTITVVAEVCLTHYGHEVEPQHLRLSKEKHQEIAAKIQQGVTRDHILNDVRKSVTDDFKRHHLTERKDMDNIIRSYGLNNVQRHTNDQQSVLAWLREWESSDEMENPVLYYKRQGVEADDGYE
ncbi:hypothetical protein AC249_AIPGENE14600 [Exaiptasia diaphana]|nr:hypothetical protein AC249_AIPGENE14600 [Exaiptasia diaphana]